MCSQCLAWVYSGLIWIWYLWFLSGLKRPPPQALQDTFGAFMISASDGQNA